MCDQPREYTAEEIRDKFLSRIKSTVQYWNSFSSKSTLERIEGTVFSILATIDGSDIDLPAFSLITSPHPSDKKYCQDNGENWFPEVDICDVELHHLYASKYSNRH